MRTACALIGRDGKGGDAAGVANSRFSLPRRLVCGAAKPPQHTQRPTRSAHQHGARAAKFIACGRHETPSLTHGTTAQADEAAKKKRTFRKFTFRGIDLENLLDISLAQRYDELMSLLNARQRRHFTRTPKRKEMTLLKKLRKSKREAGPLDRPETVRTHLRNMVVIPEMVGSVVGVYNGKEFVTVEIKVRVLHVWPPLLRREQLLACACAGRQQHVAFRACCCSCALRHAKCVSWADAGRLASLAVSWLCRIACRALPVRVVELVMQPALCDVPACVPHVLTRHLACVSPSPP